MRPSRHKLLLLAILTLIYNYFFWQEKFGINIAIYTILLIIPMALYNNESLRKPNSNLSILFTLVAAGCVVIHNSYISKLALFISFFVMTGFLHQRELRTTFAALIQYAMSFLATLMGLFRAFSLPAEKQTGTEKILFKTFRAFKLLFIPLIAFVVFLFIFKSANPVFDELTTDFWDNILKHIKQVFDKISWARIFFILFGIYLTGTFLFNWNISGLLSWEKSKHDNIQRARRKKYFSNIIGLKNEYRIALFLIIAVNLLLLTVNAIDVKFLWLNFDYEKAGKLADLVHEGTYMLIFSIILSMAILMYYFRRSLNFYGKNKPLLAAAMIWIVQNVVLAISVLLRCYYYIHEHGLGYKRIGVAVFLTLTFFGLLTLFRKIVAKKSFFYMVRANSWSFYLMLILLALVNWDLFIVEHNLKQPNLNVYGKMDIGFILSRSDRALHIIDQHLDKIDFSAADAHSYTTYKISRLKTSIDRKTGKEYFDKRVRQFLQRQEKYTWLSWNYADDKTYNYFKQKQQLP